MAANYIDPATWAELAGRSLADVGETRNYLYAEAASRLLDRALGVAPGMFAPIDAATVIVPSMGGSRLYLRDAQGRQLFLRTVSADGIKIDTDSDGSFDDYLFDFNDAWVRGVSDIDGDQTDDAIYTAIDLVPISSATLTAFPKGDYTVQIAGTAWGLPQTPMAIVARVFDIAQAMSQRGYAGAYGIDEGLQQGGAPAWVMRLVDGLYSWRMPI